MKSYQRLLLAIVIISFSFLLAKITEKNLENDFSESSRPVIQKLPSFRLLDLNGEMKDSYLLAQDQEFTIIHFWGTWCGPCDEEFPGFLNFIESISKTRRVKALMIATRDSRDNVERFLKGKNLPLPKDVVILIDPEGATQKLFNTLKVPETYIFNDKFEALNKFAGPQNWESSHYLEIFNSL